MQDLKFVQGNLAKNAGFEDKNQGIMRAQAYCSYLIIHIFYYFDFWVKICEFAYTFFSKRPILG